jgi:fermentation-respiration switch protein FrsA (DUF1100 family)
MLVWGFNSREKIGRVRAPMLFIQGDRDEIIPLRLGQALYAAAPEPKSFWVVPGAGHNDIVEEGGAAYGQKLRAFYRPWLGMIEGQINWGSRKLQASPAAYVRQ